MTQDRTPRRHATRRSRVVVGAVSTMAGVALVGKMHACADGSATNTGIVGWVLFAASVLGLPSAWNRLPSVSGSTGCSISIASLEAQLSSSRRFTSWRSWSTPMSTSTSSTYSCRSPGPGAPDRDGMWGVISLYLLVAVEITSLLKRHMPKRAWKAIHLLSFLLYVSSTVHLLSVGTDALDPLLWWTVLGTAGLIGALTAERIGSDA